jgi:type III restriction enzyme
MPSARNTGTRDFPLKFAASLTDVVNDSYINGEMLAKVTPITRDLLRYWFSDTFTEVRKFNFHLGQRQAILNTIYVHEILKTKNVFDMYNIVDEEVLSEMGISEIRSAKYNYPKYCMKMATGTGKTWVMHALMVWQYLNAKYEEMSNGSYSKNFLIVAPGLIVYERLLDAYLGKETEDGYRNFETSDFFKFRELFIPDAYKDMLFSFIQNSVVKKDEISKKVLGDGMIAITNWHLLVGDEEEEDDSDDPFINPMAVVKDLLPISPGTTAGHTLESLDSRYFRGSELEYLANLNDIVVINDEAHHIHEVKTAGQTTEVEWQKSLEFIAEKKSSRFIQIDFSATPYNVTGSGQKRTRHYFPHIIVDFDLKTAIHKGLVKTIVLDKRKELASESLAALDFKAERDGSNNPIALSEGQKIMLRAGISKLGILEKQFEDFTKNDKVAKYPKMLIVCEDTKVSPLVVDYLIQYEGLSEDDVMQIDSDKKGSIPDLEWREIKRTLFSVDNHAKPKVIVSVLMLREGFDVNNICVIVPLRSSEAPILLEQIVGRGLRLMWRGDDYEEIKAENRERLLVKKQEPSNYFDILSIVEHPAFIQFYKDLVKEGIIAEASEMGNDRGSILGDIIEIGLKNDYKNYDLFFPIVIQDKEELLVDKDIPVESLQPFTSFSFEQLKKFTKNVGNTFYSDEITVHTQFGNYKVEEGVFNAKSYNEFLSRLVGAMSADKTGTRKMERFPFMQINSAKLAATIDVYIRTRLFSRDLNPLEDGNWRILMLQDIVNHIVEEISKAVYQMQNNIMVEDAVVLKRYFSEISTMRIRENYCVPISKSIYNMLPFPSNKGIFEKDFIEFLDKDAAVERFMKIKENYHDYAYITYIRKDGMLSRYYPDFLVKIEKDIYLVETKAEKDMDNANVIAKKKSALEWVKKINDLKPDERMDSIWHYSLVSDSLFYQFKANGASAAEVLKFARIKTADTVEGQLHLFDLDDTITGK